MAWAYVAHTDSRFDLDTLERFVRAYQRVQPLRIGELWAIAIHLRVALVENLRRLAEQTARSRMAWSKADELADRLLGLGDLPPQDVATVLSRLSDTPLTDAFAVELVQRLRDQDRSVMPVLQWLGSQLRDSGTSMQEIVAHEQQAQAEANVTVRHIITSMRWMSSIDWQDFVEGVSLVDRVLRTAPGFETMDFATRNEYRNQIELLSRRSTFSETEIAERAVAQASAAVDPPNDDPGYHLVSRGRRALEKTLGFKVPVTLRFRRALRSLATPGYLTAIAAVTALLVAVPMYLSWSAGADPWVLLVLGLLGLLPASEVGMTLVNRLVPVVLPPTLLPKLELADGVPEAFKTMIVVPTLLTSHAEVEEQLERLEVHYLANPEGFLHFALISDWRDASSETMPDDSLLLNEMADGIDRLNERYGSTPGGGDRFLLLHRRRVWNEREGTKGKWMGWERKRGKLHELNRLLRGATDTTFLPIKGRQPTVPQGVRFVITLDSDTRLPKGAAYRLVGAMAHPLNRPKYDEKAGRVVEGHAILQPRITPSLPTGPGSTPYQQLISGPGGVDPYAAAVSDVYQDLFDEGSFTGKGIYDVDAFETALGGKCPENTLLSHDLFEGNFARAGLVTDIDLFEEFPSNYEVAARRTHRWVRGDWQLLPWIFGRARDESGHELKARLPLHGRWKMIDNLRRSLQAPGTFLLALAAWILPGINPVLWTGLFLGTIVVPAVIPLMDGIFRSARESPSAITSVAYATMPSWHLCSLCLP